MLLYPALRSGKHRTLISLYVVECLEDINSIVFLGVEASKILATPTTTFALDGMSVFNAYAYQSISTARSVLLLGLCINLWMAVHRPHINADRDWFWWYVLVAVVLALLSSIPVFVWEHIHEPNTWAQTLFAYFNCYVNDRLISSAAIIYGQFSLNAISMILMCTYICKQFDIYPGLSTNFNYQSTLPSPLFDIKLKFFDILRPPPMKLRRPYSLAFVRIVVRMLCCSIIASVVVFWLDLQAVIDMASNKDDDNNLTLNNASLNIFIGVSRFTVGSLPRFKSTFSTGAEPEGEWQELGSVIEPTESNKYHPGHV
ncbi:hypothetical protein INT44_001489 [Umbelopsis vinacea]|uniref:Uncharacterized protein n=1 Tax=Umbelopsis vinacea TaxID=44442 RepID=A0A8H7PRS6_9FUNG|nr:hypothetical protein INT44_001489 [Umbelopsis vinacea]